MRSQQSQNADGTTRMPELADRALMHEKSSDTPSANSEGDLAAPVKERADFLFHEQQLRIYKRVDRLFAFLMIAQWLAGIVTAIFISPRAWAGTEYSVHPHVWVAILLGAAI